MTILTKGFHFTCQCGIEAEANVASDFHNVRCNGTDNYYVTCPNCGQKIGIAEIEIPTHIKPYIRIEVRGWNHAD